MTPYERVLAALRERDLLVSSWGTGQRARCPSHDDSRPSLSVGEGDEGRALVYCFAGCSYNDVVDALGLSVTDLFGTQVEGTNTPVAEYVYTDEEGQPLFRVIRTEPKGFFQERWEDGEWKPGLRDARRVLFNLPALLAADEVWITEGEKDVLSLMAEGRTATTCPGGSSNYRDEYTEWFRGKDVVLVGDRDEAGERMVSRIRLALVDVAKSIRVLVPAGDANDVSQHLCDGWTLDELLPGDGVDLTEFAPVDWRSFEVEDTQWLFEPYVPAGGRTLVFGKRGSLKSLWAMWLASHLSREGRKVAYFSIEMQPSDTVKRLRQLNADPENMLVFTKDLDLTNPNHIDKLMVGLRNFDLIVVDSWSSAHTFGRSRMNANDEVAALDKQVLMPLIRETGATIMLIDNQGWDGDDGATGHVRGASAKEDKMETCLWFERPKPVDNYLTRLSVTKMRLDVPMPAPVDIRTPQDRIEFYEEPSGLPHWPGMRVEPEDADSVVVPEQTPDVKVPASLTPQQAFEARRLARVKDKFGITEAE